ncbi:MAG: hypothetical protein JWO02_943 [Solirubrobacterales bacterium]|nr:hypothetical protein [Solirubrobacterales bacterium]
MFIRSRLWASAAAVMALSVPVAAASPAAAAVGPLNATSGSSHVCLSGVTDPGPLGPSGPYGSQGPYGPNGPLHGATNPLASDVNCGGALAFMLNGGTIDSFVQANLASVGQ